MGSCKEILGTLQGDAHFLGKDIVKVRLKCEGPDTEDVREIPNNIGVKKCNAAAEVMKEVGRLGRKT
jgi:methanogenic corrinoid protein MtbC1